MLKRLGNYELTEEIGRGGMGIVYQGRQLSLQREVAIKILPKQLTMDTGFIKRFKREAETVAKLNHPGIVTIYDMGQEGELYYYAMEFIEGQSLERVLRERGILPLGETLDILIQAAEALSYAHERGVVHRDIKPSNIMLAKDGRVKLTDFGIAKLFEGTQITTTGGIIGTPEYMSPEQAKGAAVDERADIYSLGIILYQAMAGRVPFKSETATSILQMQVHSMYESPRLFNPEVHPAAEKVMAKMLEKDKEKRYKSAKHLLVALKALKATIQKTEASKASSLAPPPITLKKDAEKTEEFVPLEAPSFGPKRPLTVAEARERRLKRQKAQRKKALLLSPLVILALLGLYGLWKAMEDPTQRAINEHLEMGDFSLKQGNYQKAKDEFQAALDLDPTNERAKLGRKTAHNAYINDYIRKRAEAEPPPQPPPSAQPKATPPPQPAPPPSASSSGSPNLTPEELRAIREEKIRERMRERRMMERAQKAPEEALGGEEEPFPPEEESSEENLFKEESLPEEGP